MFAREGETGFCVVHRGAVIKADHFKNRGMKVCVDIGRHMISFRRQRQRLRHEHARTFVLPEYPFDQRKIDLCRHANILGETIGELAVPLGTVERHSLF